jgi:malate permease and related proteins
MSLVELINTFSNNLLPILLVSAGGFLLGKYLHVDSRSVGRVSFYIFNPVLVFNLLVHNQLPPQEIAKVALISISVMAISGVLALGGGLLLHLERPALIAVLIMAMFANNGNYGMSLTSFAFGQEALAHSTIYFVTTAVLFNTVGVLIASLGHLSIKDAFSGLLRVPTMYALIIALIITQFHLTLPIPLDRAVTLMSGATIPLLLVLLGLELQKVTWNGNLRAVGLVTIIRLVAGVLIGLALVSLFGMRGAARQGSVIESSMPPAITNTILASEYNLDTSLTAAAIFVSTILSPLTLTPLLVFLGK